MSETTTRTRIAEVSRVIVVIKDQDKAIDFYCNKLGFEKRADDPYGDGQRGVEVAPPGSQAALALCPPMGSATTGQMTGVCLTSDDLEADHAELRARGVDVDAEIMRGPDIPSMFWFRDLDGNTLLLVQRQS